jgi:predicted transcriptional regulator with HTH domain
MIIIELSLNIHDSKSLTAKATIDVGVGKAVKLIRSDDNVEIQLTNITYEIFPDPDQMSETITVYHHVRWNGDFHVVEVTVYEEIEEDGVKALRLMGAGSSNTQDPNTTRLF